MQKLLLRSTLSPGDAVMMTAAVRDLHRAFPGRFATDVRTSAMEIWENNPYVTSLDEADSDVRVIDMHYPLIERCNTAPYHFIHGYAQFLEQQLDVRVPVTEFKGDVHLAHAEKEWMSQVEELGCEGRFWIMMAGGKYDFTAKWWDPGCYQAVVNHFAGRIQFVQCGEQGHWHPPLENTINLVGKTDVRQFIRLMYHADGVVCPVTFAMHLAAAVETKPGRPRHRACVVIAGGREPPHWEAYPFHQFISTNGSLDCCDHGGCWKSRCQQVGDGDEKDIDLCEYPISVSETLRIPKCMQIIRPEDVIRRIELYYEGGALSYNSSGAASLERPVAAAKIISLAAAVHLAHRYRRERRRVVFTNGCFDVLHAGHIECLEQAARCGDVLMVAVNTDASVRRLKGSGRPIHGQAERMRLLAALECVNHVLTFDDDTPVHLLDQIRPDMLVKGGTYRIDEVVGREIVLGYGGEVRVTGAVPGHSTSATLARLDASDAQLESVNDRADIGVAAPAAFRQHTASDSLGGEMISISFDHGLGDCSNFAHIIPLYLRRGHAIEIECTPDKAPLFRAAGADIVDAAAEAHDWAHAPDAAWPDHDNDSDGNKIAFNLSRAPLADIGGPDGLWSELCQVELTLEPLLTRAHRDNVDRWLDSISGPLVCLHTRGNTSPESKDLDRQQATSLYHGLLDQTDATLLLLDWDNRVPRMASHRVRHLSQIPGADLLTLFCLLERAALLIAVDSGPQHFARFTKCPVIGLWTHHFPSHFALPRRGTLHVVSQEWHDWSKFRRVPFQIVECPTGKELNGEWIASLGAECLPTLEDPDWARLALLRQWMSWQRSDAGGELSEFVDRHRSSERILATLKRPNPIMVETGCIRAEEDWAGAGFSTYFFAAAIERAGGRLHSIELSPENAAFAKSWTDRFGDTVVVHLRHSHEFLRGWVGPIDVFLSDSADVGVDGYQENCLIECQLAAPHVRRDGLIAIDDCVWNGGRWTGKGAMAVPWLLESGWAVVYSGYQTLLKRR